MAWQDILGHQRLEHWFRSVVQQGRLASTFLFVGPPGIGKRTFAIQLAQSLLCETVAETQLDACGTCPACQQVQAGTHPDLHVVARYAEKSNILLEQLIGDDEHRMQEGLCHDIALKPFAGGRKIAIIDDADCLNVEGANCLLKTLEEPPPQSVIVLISTSEQRQLPTIRSRSQIVRFQPLSYAEVEELIRRTGMAESDDEVRTLSSLSGGSLETAQQFAPPEVREFRDRWLQILAELDETPFHFVKELMTFVEAAGKETAAKRARLKLVARMAAGFYRGWLALPGSELDGDHLVHQAVDRATQRCGQDLERVVQCLDRCLELENQIEANANLATLVEVWLDDLAQVTLGIGV
ncbi:MAG: ATP-binding protein [Pirellulaceae bacterium]